MNLWSEEVSGASALIESVLKGLDPSLEFVAEGQRGFFNDTVNVAISKGYLKAFAVVTREAWTNAKTDPEQMKQALEEVIDKLKPEPDAVFLITSPGLRETPIGVDWRCLQEPYGWEPFEDEAQGYETDTIVTRLLEKQDTEA